jgi:hypothetical protein
MSVLKHFFIWSFLIIFTFTTCGCATLSSNPAVKSSGISGEQVKKLDYSNAPEEDSDESSSSSKMMAVSVGIILLVSVAAYALAGFGLYSLGRSVATHYGH